MSEPLILKSDQWNAPQSIEDCTMIQGRVKYNALTGVVVKFEVGATARQTGEDIPFMFEPEFDPLVQWDDYPRLYAILAAQIIGHRNDAVSDHLLNYPKVGILDGLGGTMN